MTIWDYATKKPNLTTYWQQMSPIMVFLTFSFKFEFLSTVDVFTRIKPSLSMHIHVRSQTPYMLQQSITVRGLKCIQWNLIQLLVPKLLIIISPHRINVPFRISMMVITRRQSDGIVLQGRRITSFQPQSFQVRSRVTHLAKTSIVVKSNCNSIQWGHSNIFCCMNEYENGKCVVQRP